MAKDTSDQNNDNPDGKEQSIESPEMDKRIEVDKSEIEQVEKNIEKHVEEFLESKLDQKFGIIEERMVAWSGPIPPPEIMNGFERVFSGSADRILAMTEKQGAHRRKMEELQAKHSFISTTIGQLFALIAMLALVVSGTICIIKGYSVSGTILGGSGLVGVILAFIAGHRGSTPDDE